MKFDNISTKELVARRDRVAKMREEKINAYENAKNNPQINSKAFVKVISDLTDSLCEIQEELNNRNAY